MTRATRRAVLGSAGLALAGLTAGCGFLGGGSNRAAPIVADRPDAVYYPSHVEGMAMAGTARAGRYRFALSFSFPHRFWLVTGTRTNLVEAGTDTDVHLMLTAWDADTGRVLPSANQHVTVTGNGERPVDRALWPMLSQNMGVHFGDNVALAGEGTYEVTVDFGPGGSRTIGSLAGTFGEAARATITVEFRRSALEDLSYRRLPDRAGSRGAVSPMQMDAVPVARVPASDDLPGRRLGEATTGDAAVPATLLAEPPAGVDGAGQYLVVSPRTPYNRYPLPFMGLSATLHAGGRPAFEGSLSPAIDGDLGYHYGAVVGDVGDPTALDVVPGAPPQLARHEGYETAFLDMPATTITA